MQLSLFVPPQAGVELERLRRVLDPVQAALIPAHVTLCREDELAGLPLAEMEARLGAAWARAIHLEFGPAKAFAEHGVLLPCVAGAEAFQKLRRWVLGSDPVREHAPHLTLAHPRNPRAPGNTAAAVRELTAARSVEFATVFHIQQTGAAAWQVLQRYSLASR